MIHAGQHSGCTANMHISCPPIDSEKGVLEVAGLLLELVNLLLELVNKLAVDLPLSCKVLVG